MDPKVRALFDGLKENHNKYHMHVLDDSPELARVLFSPKIGVDTDAIWVMSHTEGFVSSTHLIESFACSRGIMFQYTIRGVEQRMQYTILWKPFEHIDSADPFEYIVPAEKPEPARIPTVWDHLVEESRE